MLFAILLSLGPLVGSMSQSAKECEHFELLHLVGSMEILDNFAVGSLDVKC